MDNKKIGQHTFNFSKQNGDEDLILVTDFFENGDGEVYTNQQLTLNSCCNSASFNLCGIALNPDVLRKLANELEKATIQVTNKVVVS